MGRICILAALFTFLIAFNSCGIKAEDEAEPQASEVTEAPVVESTGPVASDDADVVFTFTRPITGKPYEFPIGKDVHFLVGFKNKAQKDFRVNTMHASFRYSLDFNYILQNFTTYPYDKLVEPNQETTLGYTFFISEQYAPRAYGFTVNLLYSDKDGVQYQNTVFNETVNLIEVDDGLDSESFFLYIILLGFLGLGCYGLNHAYVKYVNPSRRSSSKPKAEPVKDVNKNEVDFDWLPPSMVANLKKTSTAPKKAQTSAKAAAAN